MNAISTITNFILPGDPITYDELIVFTEEESRVIGSLEQSSEEINESILEKLNAERSRYNLKPFKLHGKLIKAAQSHSDEMAQRNKLNHYGANGSTWYQRCKEAGYEVANAGNIGEDVAAGQRTVDKVIKDFMGSSGHRAPILSTKYVHIGSGYTVSSLSGYGTFWCINFGFGAKDDTFEEEDLDRSLFDFIM